MANAKRWTVTYTKHIKQKRKVYQDGLLELHDSTSKVMLYDECDKLLECRLLKKDEIVTSGESLMFNGYLVDIGDPEGNNISVSDTNGDRIDKNIVGRPNRSNGSNPRIPSGDSKINVKENKVHHALSPSQKIIKEFKKKELLKYVSPKISPETRPSTSEWQVLYTTQVTQKAKKYHDGFLQLVINGSRGRQVTLFDASRKLLDSRFLMKNDIIRAGESLAFDAYLVDIGEKQGNHEPDSSVLGNKCTDAEGIRKMQRQPNCLDTNAPARKSEWQVVYAARSTKKIKKYLDGFLQMANLGSQERQVVLCDLSKTPIERRFLKKDEVIRPGESIYFDDHLVDVEEPEGSHQSPINLDEQGTDDNVVQRRQIRQGQNGCLKANSFVVKGEPEGSHQSPINLDEQGTDDNVVQRRQIRQGQNGCLKANSFVVKGKPPSMAYFARESDLNPPFSGSDVIKSNRIVPPIKPLRDTQQILSILQNRVALESNVTGGRPTTASVPNLSSSENLHGRELIKTAKSLDVMSSKDTAAAIGGASLQFPENNGTSYQLYSHEEAQTNMNEGKSDEELSCKREMNECPSFALGF